MVKLYNEGIKKMNQEFDMMNILKALRKEEDQVIDLDSEADVTAPADDLSLNQTSITLHREGEENLNEMSNLRL